MRNLSRPLAATVLCLLTACAPPAAENPDQQQAPPDGAPSTASHDPSVSSAEQIVAVPDEERHDESGQDHHHHSHTHVRTPDPDIARHHITSGHSTHGDLHQHSLGQPQPHHSHPHSHLTPAELWDTFMAQMDMGPAPSDTGE